METRSTLLRQVRDLADVEGWGEFVEIYQPLIVRYSRSRGASEEGARDVAQEVFARFLRVLPTFELDRTRGRFRSWLYRVTLSIVVDEAKGLGRREAAEQEWQNRRDDDPDQIKWDRALDRRVREYALAKVREEVAPRAWACFERQLLKGRSAKEVAQELDITPESVYVNSSRVRKKVRAACAKYLGEDHVDSDNLPG
jgi:RNA polymerase sigma-70 factor (ECF subfamily)